MFSVTHSQPGDYRYQGISRHGIDPIKWNIPYSAAEELNNTLRTRQNGRRFADDTFKRIFLNENIRIWISISLKFVPKGRINNIPALVQIMAWCRPGDKPLSEPMMVSLLTHICVTRPQWVNEDCNVYVAMITHRVGCGIYLLGNICDFCMMCLHLQWDNWYSLAHHYDLLHLLATRHDQLRLCSHVCFYGEIYNRRNCECAFIALFWCHMCVIITVTS